VCHRHSEVTVIKADVVEEQRGVQVVVRCG